MKSLRLLVAVATVIAVGMGVFVPGEANAQITFYFTDGTGNHLWNDGDNWKTACTNGQTGTVPSASDDAEICANKTAIVTNTSAVAKQVTINLGAKIQIDPSSNDATLTLGSGTTDLTSTLQGPIELNPNGAAHIAKLAFVSANHKLTNSSFVRGFQDDAVIDIQTSGKTLMIDVNASIRGRLVISGAGNLDNRGFVSANPSMGGTLTVAVTGTISDTADGNRWRVSATDATLLFDAPSATGLVGNFLIDGNGTLQIDDTVTSTGRLQQSMGAVQVNANFTLGNASHHASLTGGTITVANTKQFVHN